MSLDGAACGATSSLVDVLARNLYGRASAVIDVDLAGMTEDQSISTLLGSAPGLIGSDRSLPLHALRRAPWQVVLFRGIDRCAIPIRDTIAQALERGSFTDAMGRSLPLGATVVVMTAEAIETADVLEPLLGKSLITSCTVVTGKAGSVADSGRDAWLHREVLDPLANRFARQGYEISFDPKFVAWLGEHLPTGGESVTDYVDRSVTPALAATLPSTLGRLVATIKDDQPAFDPAPAVA